MASDMFNKLTKVKATLAHNKITSLRIRLTAKT